MFLPDGPTSRLLQNTYYFTVINSLTLGVKIASADISVVTRISLNGKYKSFLAIPTGGDLSTKNLCQF
jgi:hypothetical protein